MPPDARPASRSHAAIAAVQMTLVLMSVAIARLPGIGRASTVVIVGLALANGALVAWSALGLRRQWGPVYIVGAVVLITSGLLLVWPAWGLYDRVRSP